jgi:hypothetical protein
MNILSLLAADDNIASAFRAPFAELKLVPKRKKPAEIQVSVGYRHPDDDALLQWYPAWLSRSQAAEALRAARRNKARIELSVEGYCITGEWR